jgi:ribonuclease HI
MPHTSASPGLFPPPATPSGTWISAHCDGGARGNPGPSGFGALIQASDGTVLAELSEFLGIQTNNFAEYSGLLASLDFALAHGHRRLRVVSDSELMVKHGFEIVHALRHKNKDADRLANQAMDRGMKR